MESCRELPAGARQRRKKAELALEQPAEEMEFHDAVRAILRKQCRNPTVTGSIRACRRSLYEIEWYRAER